MPRKTSNHTAAKTTTKSSPKKTLSAKTSRVKADSAPMMASTQPMRPLSPKALIPILIAVLLGTAFFYGAKKYRGLVIAAMVGKTPITTMELNKTLTARYGSSVLDELINQKLLVQLADKEKVAVSQPDIDAEIKKLEDNLGGKDGLKQAMDQYGLTDSDLRSQIQIRLLQQKIAEKLFKADVTQDEIQKYFDDNKAIYTGKKLADVQADIKTSLEQQKLQQQFVTWFQDQRKAANVQIYLNK